MLSELPIVAFVGVTAAERAKAFYGGKLGLRLVKEELPFALEYDAHGTMLRVTLVPKVVPAGYTVLGWITADIASEIKALNRVGVVFERYPGMVQDALGIWTAPGGAMVAWFRDPDGNTLSLSQIP